MEHVPRLTANIGVVIAVSVAIYVTKSAWPLLGLLFLMGYTRDKCDD